MRHFARPSSAYCVLLPVLTASLLVSAASGQDLVRSRDGRAVGYKDTPVLPWTQWHKHDPDRPLPPEITPGRPSTQERAGTAPSDAVVLFDGDDLDAWQPSQWVVEHGELVVTEGDLESRQSFGDCQLHVEWQAPDPPRGPQMNRGNSGVMLMKRYEIQIADSYTEKIYPDGSAASVYGETPPLVNATLPPGQWQTYDILFIAPRFKDGALVSPARVTMLHNGVLVHLNTEIHGPVAWREIKPYEPHPAEQPLVLQAHGNPVRFRNIWIRPLNLAAEAAPAKARQADAEAADDLPAVRPADIPHARGAALRLFNGRDLTGWTAYLPDGTPMENVWRVENGVLICKGEPAGYLRTKEKYTNYRLTLKWRWSPETKQAGNSGVLLRVIGEEKIWPRCVEAQLQHGNAGDFWNIGDFPMKTDPARTSGANTRKLEAAEKPVGEWNEYDILVNGDRVVLIVNGKLVNEASEVREVPGWIALQSEGAEIHFRDIWLEPLR